MEAKYPREGARLRSLREATGLSQDDVARVLLVDQAAVSNWERGVNLPLRKYRPKMAKMYGCDADELLAAKTEA